MCNDTEKNIKNRERDAHIRDNMSRYYGDDSMQLVASNDDYGLVMHFESGQAVSADIFEFQEWSGKRGFIGELVVSISRKNTNDFYMVAMKMFEAFSKELE